MEIFVVCTGQDDNIGDVVLRRRMLTILQSLGRCHVFVADASPEFVEGLCIEADHVVHRQYGPWLARCTVGIARGDAILVHNAGELVGNYYTVKRAVSLVPASIAARVRGGAVLRVGVGMRNGDGIWMRLHRWLARLATVNVWRDATTRDFFGVGEVLPDWAFDAALPPSGAEPPDGTARDTLTVSFRHDVTPPTQAWIRGVKQFADAQGLRIVTAAQVRRDNRSATDLAVRLDAETLLWPDESSHLEQERRLRTLFRSSAAILSDRLHVLIVGLVEGAIPTAVTATANVKLQRSLAPAGFHDVVVDASNMTDADDVAAALTRVYAAHADAASRLGSARAAVHQADAIFRDARASRGAA